MSRSLGRCILKYGESFKVETRPINTLVDTHGRKHDYLRISLTEKCNLRCRYCMPEKGVDLTERSKLIDLDEIKRLASIFVKFCGIKKVRLTGGEPTIDRKLIPLLGQLNELRKDGLETVALTTNGLNLKDHATKLKASGLNAINISLDTLKEDRFKFITRRKGLASVYDGLLSAIESGFDSIKLNCVVVRDFNDDELLEFVDLAERLPIEVRFIEFMPFAGNNWGSHQMVTYREMLSKVESKHPDLAPIELSINNTSKVFKSPSMRGSIGFISSMSENFCSGCNRLRLTSDGNLKVCLFDAREKSLRDLMRHGATDSEIIAAIHKALGLKWRQHAGRFIQSFMRSSD